MLKYKARRMLLHTSMVDRPRSCLCNPKLFGEMKNGTSSLHRSKLSYRGVRRQWVAKSLFQPPNLVVDRFSLVCSAVCICNSKGFFHLLFMKVCDVTAYSMQRMTSQKLLLIKRKSGCNNHLHLGKTVLHLFSQWCSVGIIFVSENCVAYLLPDKYQTEEQGFYTAGVWQKGSRDNQVEEKSFSFGADLEGVNKIEGKQNQWDSSMDEQTQQKRDFKIWVLPGASSTKKDAHCQSPALVWGLVQPLLLAEVAWTGEGSVHLEPPSIPAPRGGLWLVFQSRNGAQGCVLTNRWL